MRPTKDRQDFCIPGPVGKDRTPRGALFICNLHQEATKSGSTLRNTVNLLIHFLTDLLPFTFQRLYDIFILDLSLLTHTASKGASERWPGVPALYLHIKPGANTQQAANTPPEGPRPRPLPSAVNEISLY